MFTILFECKSGLRCQVGGYPPTISPWAKISLLQDAAPAQIKSAFKKLTLKLHPDKNDSPDADVQFRNLVSVHNILKDPGKRDKYV